MHKNDTFLPARSIYPRIVSWSNMMVYDQSERPAASPLGTKAATRSSCSLASRSRQLNCPSRWKACARIQSSRGPARARWRGVPSRGRWTTIVPAVEGAAAVCAVEARRGVAPSCGARRSRQAWRERWQLRGADQLSNAPTAPEACVLSQRRCHVEALREGGGERMCRSLARGGACLARRVNPPLDPPLGSTCPVQALGQQGAEDGAGEGVFGDSAAVEL